MDAKPDATLLSKRTQLMKPSPILALAAKANEMKASGKDIISLTIGEPDWGTFEIIKESGIKAIRDGKTTYAPANGILPLRQAIATQTSGDTGLKYEPADVTVSSGAKMILFSAFQCLLDEGDEILLLAPFWASYTTMAELAGARIRIASCPKETNFKITPDLLRSSLTEKTKVVLINSPSNPTGMTYTAQELKALAVVLREFPRVVVMSDDIYNRLCLDGPDAPEGGPVKVAPHLLQVAPDLRERVLIINGASKSYAMTGWRLGWGVGPRALINAMSGYQSQSVSCASMISQVAAVDAILKSEKDISATVALLKTRASAILGGLEKIPEVKAYAPQGAFYIWMDVSSYLGKTHKGRVMHSSADMADVMLNEHLLAVVPGIDFGVEGFFRLSFATDAELLKKAAVRMGEFFKTLV
jgi:aspartate aminotransferase